MPYLEDYHSQRSLAYCETSLKINQLSTEQKIIKNYKNAEKIPSIMEVLEQKLVRVNISTSGHHGLQITNQLGYHALLPPLAHAGKQQQG